MDEHGRSWKVIEQGDRTGAFNQLCTWIRVASSTPNTGEKGYLSFWVSWGGQPFLVAKSPFLLANPNVFFG